MASKKDKARRKAVRKLRRFAKALQAVRDTAVDLDGQLYAHGSPGKKVTKAARELDALLVYSTLDELEATVTAIVNEL